MKDKNKVEYLRKKRLKQLAKKRESEHKIDYSQYNPVKDSKQYRERNSHFRGDGSMELAMMMLMMRRKYRR